MNIILYAVFTVIFIVSLSGNAFFYFKTKQNPKRTESKELQEFLIDIAQGVGVIAVTRINPEDMLMRSPRQRQ